MQWKIILDSFVTGRVGGHTWMLKEVCFWNASGETTLQSIGNEYIGDEP